MNAAGVAWEHVARYPPVWWRNLSVSSRLTFRLFRDGFHALAVLASGHIVAAVPGAILTLAPGEDEFRVSHRILRGTRPLHIAVTPDDHVFWGEYFDNPGRDEVHIYASADRGATWNVAYTFPRGAIRHVHNIVYDQWAQMSLGAYRRYWRRMPDSAGFVRFQECGRGSFRTPAGARRRSRSRHPKGCTFPPTRRSNRTTCTVSTGEGSSPNLRP